MDRPIKAFCYAGGTGTLLARVVDNLNDLLTQADISGIRYTIYQVDQSDPSDRTTTITGHVNVAITVATSVYDTLQTGDMWDVDSTGYNFLYTIGNITNQPFPSPYKTYLVVVTFTLTTGQTVVAQWRVSTDG